jgi:dephospho-CoA kinase
MRQLIFSNPVAKKQLESILHPLIRTQMFAQAEAFAGISPYALLVIPLLYESGNYLEKLQRTLVVDCSETTQIQRTIQRSGLPEEEVIRIIAQQIPRAERLQCADDVIQNDAALAPLKQQVIQLHQHYLELSSGSD